MRSFANDRDTLRLELAQPGALNLEVDLDAIGFDAIEIDIMLTAGGNAGEPDQDDDAVRPAAIAVSRVGNV